MLTRPDFPLWPYQAKAVDQIEAALDRAGSVLFQLATGGGKTRVAVKIARRVRYWPDTVIWFVCHRHEILHQTSRTFDAAGIMHGVVAARAMLRRLALPFGPGCQVQVCTIATLAHRPDEIRPPTLVIWDEAQHVPAASWSALRERYPNAKHLGLSATPARLDGVGLQSCFSEIVCGPSTCELIEGGFLSRYRVFAPTIPDMRGVTMRAGDYAKGDADKAMRPVIVGDVVEHYNRLTPGARALAFAVSVEASRSVAERFRAAGIPAAHVDADTPHNTREAAIADFRAGRIKVLSNVELFTEDFDLPTIDALILLRPTKSLALYLQMIGRGLRSAPGKAETIILDHAGLVHEHGMPDDRYEWTLDGVSPIRMDAADGEGGSRLRRCPECTAVHEWSAECPSCAYVYGLQDRTIDEVYGFLAEQARPSKPQGYETIGGFAKSHNTYSLK